MQSKGERSKDLNKVNFVKSAIVDFSRFYDFSIFFGKRFESSFMEQAVSLRSSSFSQHFGTGDRVHKVISG